MDVRSREQESSDDGAENADDVDYYSQDAEYEV